MFFDSLWIDYSERWVWIAFDYQLITSLIGIIDLDGLKIGHLKFTVHRVHYIDSCSVKYCNVTDYKYVSWFVFLLLILEFCTDSLTGFIFC